MSVCEGFRPIEAGSAYRLPGGDELCRLLGSAGSSSGVRFLQKPLELTFSLSFTRYGLRSVNSRAVCR